MQRRLGLLVSGYSNTSSNNTGTITQPHRSSLHIKLPKFSTAHYNHPLNNTLRDKATNPIVSNLIPYPNYHHNHSPYWAALIRRSNQSFINRRSMSSSKHFPPQQQEGQPGREHEMQPSPEFVRPSYKPSDKLLGKVAIVTGGDSGIGRSIACHYAMEGAMVAITYVDTIEEKDASETLDLIKNKYIIKCSSSHGKDPIKIGVDLGVEENCQRVIKEVMDAYGKIDIIVNNAAEQHVVQIEKISSEQLERVFRTNIFSQFFLTKHALKHMKEGSCIINTTSVNAYKGNASLLDYTATKGAIVAFTRGLALQLVGRGIRVNGVAPGPVWTPLIPASFPEEKVEQFGEQVPMKRAAQPSEIGPSYVFLASDDSSYYTGQVLHPNGGVIVNA